MTGDGSPWAAPGAETEPGPAYTGPPPTARPVPAWSAALHPPHTAYGSLPPGYAPPGYAPPGYAPPGYAPPGYAPPGPYGYPPPWGRPPGPKRPGQVIASAVLAFVQAGLVALASAYLLFLSSILGLAAEQDPSSTPAALRGLPSEGTVLGIVQILSAVLLVLAGIMALNRRGRAAWLVLLAGHTVQILLALYWAVRLLALLDAIPGPDPSGAFLSFSLLFAAGPAVGLGLVVLGAGRRWFESPAPRPGDS